MANNTNSEKNLGFRERSSAQIARLKARASEAKEDVDSYIQNNPETAVLIAAGVGAVVGAVLTALIMRRRN